MILYEQQQTPSRIVQRILGSRGMPVQEAPEHMPQDKSAYEAFQLSHGNPRMGFTLGVYYRGANGVTVQSHGILYHDVKKPKWKTVDGMEFVSFSHAGEAYTLRGRGL